MPSFSKVDYECKICGLLVKSKAFSNHLKLHKIDSKSYYDHFIKKEDEGICLSCGCESIFLGLSKGYSSWCSNKECRDKLAKYHYSVILCKICGEEVSSSGPSVRRHMKNHGLTNREYYDKYLKNETDKCCKCGVDTKYVNISVGYEKYCSKCRSDHMRIVATNHDSIRKWSVNNRDKLSQISSSNLKRLHKDPEFRKRHAYRSSIRMKDMNKLNWNDPSYVSRRGIRKETSIERIIRRELDKLKFSFSQELFIKDVGLVDFYIKSYAVIVECDGDYWHSKPGAAERDHAKTKNAELKGFSVIRLSEFDINNRLEYCVSLILEETRIA